MPPTLPVNLAFDDIVIDFAGRRLLRGAAEQPLEPKAFDVLALLAGAPGRVFARDDILDAVWGHRHVTPDVLNRTVTLLRRALGEDAHHPRLLHTVHGVGYRFDLPAASVAASPAIEPAPASVAEPMPIEPPLESRAEPAPSRRLPRAAFAAAPLFATLLAFAGWKLWPRPPPATPTVAAVADERSIAVLPLVNASDDKEQQFFSDGISENLIEALSKYEGLKVVGRASSFRFRDTQDDSRTIGEKLGVAYLLGGSVQHAGDAVRISIALTKTADGSTLWSQHYDRPYKDLFAVQDEIALAVAAALQVKLLHSMAGAVETGRPASGNLDAYNAFLRGTYSMNRDAAEAIGQFAEATRLDPDYAQAWLWLGFVRAISARSRLEGEAVRADCLQARKEIETAIGLAPDYGFGYSTLAVQLSSCDYDWNGAFAQFRKAMPLVPDTSPAHGQYSRLLATLGRVNQAIDERRKFLAGDPLNAGGFDNLFQLQACLGRLDDAEASLRRAIELESDDAFFYAEEQSYLAILRDDAGTALAEARRIPPGRDRDRALALALQVGNDRAAADVALQRLVESEGNAKDGALYVARAYALRGDADGMFEWLNRDWEHRGFGAYQALNDPLLLRFRDDPRFATYCRRTGLPPPSTSEALSIDQIRAALAAKH